MTNVEKSYRAGAEIVAGFMPANFLAWDISLTLARNKIIDFTEHYVDYNTADWSSEYKSRNLGSVDIAYSPSVIGSSDISLMPIPEIELHLISKYVGKQYFDNTMNRERMLDPYLVNNIMIGFKPETKHIRSVDLQLQINNILNAKYENNAYGGNWFEDGVEKSWSYYFPQAGTNFMLKLGLRF
jgi:iron complex outermembrane receptor protein